MIDYLTKKLVTDRKGTRLFFTSIENDQEFTITVSLEYFVELFSEPLQKAIDNDTDPMDEIRAFDPDNKLGYNNLIV